MGALLERNGLERLSKEEYRKRFCFPLERFYNEVGLISEIEPFEKVAYDFIKYYDDNSRNLNLFPGVLEVLNNSSATHSILSAAPEVHLHEITKRFGIDSHFQNIYGLNHAFGDSKIKRGHELIKKLNFKKEEIILIGDTDHDLEVGRSLGVSVLLIADGHQSYERLTKVHNKVLETRLK